jgi:quercetin dioxygenase-like cupin family protein
VLGSSVGCVAAVATVAVGTGWATPPVGLTNTPLARGTDTAVGNLPIQNGMDVAMAQITVQPGGQSGWHSHPGGAIIVVQQGSLTIYRSHGNHCRIETYSAGQAFIERPREVTDVVNTTDAPYVLFVTFPRVPPGVSPRTDEPDPGTCPGV